LRTERVCGRRLQAVNDRLVDPKAAFAITGQYARVSDLRANVLPLSAIGARGRSHDMALR